MTVAIILYHDMKCTSRVTPIYRYTIIVTRDINRHTSPETITSDWNDSIGYISDTSMMNHTSLNSTPGVSVRSNIIYQSLNDGLTYEIYRIYNI